MPVSERSVRQLLREARWQSGLTQEELAGRAGLSVRTISDIERGRVACPRAATLRLLADALAMNEAQTKEFFLIGHFATADPQGTRFSWLCREGPVAAAARLRTVPAQSLCHLAQMR